MTRTIRAALALAVPALLLLVIPATLALVIPAALPAQQRDTFPHERHAPLFPSCTGCHEGIVTGEAVRARPAASQCAACHDGQLQRRVNWSPPAPRGPGLLAFSHPAHATKSGDAATCETCHSASEPARWMNVARATPEKCSVCHEAKSHLADDNKCSTCHRTLATATALSEQRVAALPKPPSHARADFLSTHGAPAGAASPTCATCHARESCERCHANAARLQPIAALARDARVARLVAGKAVPTPADHRRAEFVLEHGSTARASAARCAACHSRPSCATCHTGDGAKAVLDKLPGAAEAAGHGVRLRADWQPAAHQRDTTTYRVRVHPVDFSRAHGTLAASEAMNCSGCHAQKFCSDCHAGERNSRRYHPANFVSRHAPESYSRDTECSACHSTEAFCRDCHRQTGLAARTGNRSLAFHNAQPLWLVQHGTAARQALSTCTACHQQSYCMQCHSDAGMRINPHGPDFNAARMHSRNPTLCVRCHFKDPLGGK
jgi:hypothetical protein